MQDSSSSCGPDQVAVAASLDTPAPSAEQGRPVIPASIGFELSSIPNLQPVVAEHLSPRRDNTPLEQSIDLASMLELTAGQNPEVNFAWERIDEAFAQ
ncbi:MAG: hypothetical protein EA424_16930 [Planctomycetaceae bacterium]|nr:MAG: hypothetical protein EA424_16930 [Planctomycetaceae bacterium]